MLDQVSVFYATMQEMKIRKKNKVLRQKKRQNSNLKALENIFLKNLNSTLDTYMSMKISI